MSWFCKCGMLNNGLVRQCAFVKARNESEQDHYQVSDNTPDFLMAVEAARFARLTTPMASNEEVYIQFYNKMKNLVKDMDMTELREHQHKLSLIVYQSRAELAAADDMLREKTAKSNNKEWLVTPTQPQATSDAIAVVKVRKERMSKIDKLREQLMAIPGMEPSAVEEMIRNMERGATNANLKQASFQSKPQPQVHSEPVQQIEPLPPAEPKPEQAKDKSNVEKSNGNKPWNPFA